MRSPPQPESFDGLYVAVSSSGEARVNGHVIAPGRLRETLTRLQTATRQRRAIIEAEADVTYERVVEVLDLLRSIGFDDVAFAYPR